jgi:hypothetical protein
LRHKDHVHQRRQFDGQLSERIFLSGGMTMKRKLILLTVGVAIFLGVRYLWTGRADHQVEPLQNAIMERVTGQTAIEKLFGGKDAVATVAHPDKVAVYRLDPNLERTGNLTLEEFRITSDPIEPSHEVASRLAALLASPESYWDAPSACMPMYGVRVRFERAADRVDLLLCLECDESLIFSNGRFIGYGFFVPAHDPLVRVVQELFPDDKEIQGLKSR